MLTTKGPRFAHSVTLAAIAANAADSVAEVPPSHNFLVPVAGTSLAAAASAGHCRGTATAAFERHSAAGRGWIGRLCRSAASRLERLSTRDTLLVAGRSCRLCKSWWMAVPQQAGAPPHCAPGAAGCAPCCSFCTGSSDQSGAAAAHRTQPPAAADGSARTPSPPPAQHAGWLPCAICRRRFCRRGTSSLLSQRRPPEDRHHKSCTFGFQRWKRRPAALLPCMHGQDGECSHVSGGRTLHTSHQGASRL